MGVRRRRLLKIPIPDEQDEDGGFILGWISYVIYV